MRNSTIVVLALLVTSLASGRSTHAQTVTLANRAYVAIEREALELIEQVEESGRDVRYHADQIQRLTTSPDISRWSHYHHLDGIRDTVNRTLRPSLTRLVDAQNQLPTWKQESIDKMIAAAKELAADASSAIFHKVDNPLTPAILNDEYRTMVKQISSHAETLVKTADAAHAYGAARLKADEAGLSVSK